ncbi:MlaE family ABC transporter permease [Pseudonocardia spinosispora]|uniref:MlaE family ABC transporter permease n=1 Tax=Pseudonocardia spinosispora TaxID=103441 RepID=UPI000A013EA4|nr:ABC transporter permease [Pseudonocardia spinosispora]
MILLPRAVYSPLDMLGGIVQLGARVLYFMVRDVTGYWRSVRDEMYETLRVSWFPITLAVFSFGLMVGILALNFTTLLGANNRYGQYFFVGNVREFTPWINSMVVAGIVGAAMCADLGARKVREELDALAVLGVDGVRELVVPRIVSMTLLTPLIMCVSVFIGVQCALVSSVTYGDVPAGEYLATVYANLTVVEIVVAFLKSTIIGFVIGVVCSYLGLTASGGAAGVGRAVNQAVVISFALVFVVDLLINLIALGLYPEMQTVR